MTIIVNPIPEEYRSTQLFLLIGNNPLPDYVAARLLWDEQAPDAKLYLVCSAITYPVAERIVEEMQLAHTQVAYLRVNETEPYSVFRTVHKAAQFLTGGIGLNYTGGTKAMAVHAYHALRSLENPCVFSYLDAGSLEMVIEREGGASMRFAVERALTMSIEQILHLHGYGFHRVKKTKLFMMPEKEPHHAEFVRLWGGVGFDAIDQWTRANFQRNVGSIKDAYQTLPYADLCTIPLPREDVFEIMRSFYQQENVITFEDLAILWDMQGNKDQNGSNLANWLRTFWLEDFVLLCVQDIAAECGIHESGKSLKPFDQIMDDSKFEFDVYAIQGFRLFGISCSTEEKISQLKLKLFEARVRTTQIGGDESCTALVCMASDNPVSGSPMLKHQLKESWDTFSSRVEVIGKKDLKEETLKKRLKNWFEGRVYDE